MLRCFCLQIQMTTAAWINMNELTHHFGHEHPLDDETFWLISQICRFYDQQKITPPETYTQECKICYLIRIVFLNGITVFSYSHI